MTFSSTHCLSPATPVQTTRRAVGRFALVAFASGLLCGSPAFAADEPVNVDAYKGRVVYVDFWASWCGPCRDSFPWMKNLQSRYGKDGLVVLAINLDHDQALAQRFLDEFHPAFQVVFDSTGAMAERFQVAAMPSSFIIDRTGKARFRHDGFHAAERPDYETEVRQLLNEK